MDINTIHLSTHPLIADLLKMFNVKIIFEIREISKTSKIMDYGIYVCFFACGFFFFFFTNHKPEGISVAICILIVFETSYLECIVILGNKILGID